MIYPLIYDFLACIPSFIMYTNKELSVRQALIHKINQLIIIVAIYLGVMLIRYKMDQKTAWEMTEQLKAFQKKA